MKGMKRILSFFLTGLTLLGFFSCGRSPSLPPVREGEGVIECAYPEVKPDFDAAYREADLVALVRIGDWLGEDTEAHATFYSAEIVRTYKGEAVSPIRLIQYGDSGATAAGYPLFTAGNKMLLFLKKAEAEEEGTFWIYGSDSTVLDAVKLRKVTFFLPRDPEFGLSVKYCQNWMDGSGMKAVLSELLKRSDPLLDGDSRSFAFDEQDLSERMKTLGAGS